MVRAMIDANDTTAFTVVRAPLDSAIARLKLPEPGTSLTPAEAKSLATLIALRGLGRVAPNPLVGAVIVDSEHRFVSLGAHEKVGEAHAEVAALRNAADSGLQKAVVGGTMYVTLEPCAHVNRTPACAPQVASSGVARVIYGSPDPNPKVSGRGAAIINGAGIPCTLDQTWTADCERLAEVFLWNMRQQSPFVGLKVATSADGIMAKKGDQRVWITGPRARAYGHFLRVYYDAILVGTGTMLADDPILDPRDSLFPGRTPMRVVLDPKGRLLETRPACDWRVLGHEPTGVLWLLGDQVREPIDQAADHLKKLGAQVERLPLSNAGAFSPKTVLQTLWRRGITSVLLEGGLGVYRSFLSAGCVNRIHLFQAPKLLGGGVDAMYFADAAPSSLQFQSTCLIPLDQDWLLDAAMLPNAAGSIFGWT